MNNQEEPLNPPTDQAKNVEAYKAILDSEQQNQKLKAKESFWKAYLWSVLLPPIGVYYFIKYFFFGDGGYEIRKAAVLSLFLTIISLLANIWLIQLFLNQPIGGSGNFDTINELIKPENQENLRQLLQ